MNEFQVMLSTLSEINHMKSVKFTHHCGIYPLTLADRQTLVSL